MRPITLALMGVLVAAAPAVADTAPKWVRISGGLWANYNSVARYPNGVAISVYHGQNPGADVYAYEALVFDCNHHYQSLSRNGNIFQTVSHTWSGELEAIACLLGSEPRQHVQTTNGPRDIESDDLRAARAGKATIPSGQIGAGLGVGRN